MLASKITRKDTGIPVPPRVISCQHENLDGILDEAVESADAAMISLRILIGRI